MPGSLSSATFPFMQSQVNQTIDHLFRHEYGRIVAGLVSRFGSSKLEMVEDAVQEALLKAMQLWGFDKIPDNPTSWLFKVARNQLVDVLRRDNKSQTFDMELEEEEKEQEYFSESEIKDEQLKMIFACCNPTLNPRESLLLSLKLIGGFNVSEIAKALLLKEEAAKKSLQRARIKFRDEVGHLYVPKKKELPEYLNRVLKVVYLIFNEGYKTNKGNDLINQDLCGEALRLALILMDNEHCQTPKIYSLISLMSFKASRFNARVVNGQLITFEQQNRQLWIPEYIEWGFYYYHKATVARETSNYYLEAAIEYQYHISKSYDTIDWPAILQAYDILVSRVNSPLLKLNRLIVYSKVYDANSTLEQLNKLEPELLQNHLFYAFRSELQAQRLRVEDACKNLEMAIKLAKNNIEQEYLQQRLKNLMESI